MKMKDLTGQRFGRLLVIERGPDYVSPSGRKYVRWKCRCDCGIEKSINADALLRGQTVSCGCNSKEKARNTHITHDKSKTKLYKIWRGIKSRCYNSQQAAYKDYGGRGITMCDEWKTDFELFSEWAYQNGYDEDNHNEYSIDRIDTNGNYEPSNCRWATNVEQANNRRTNRMYEYAGEVHNVTQWAAKVGMNPKTLFNRLYAGWSFEKALTEPVKF